MKYNIIFTKKVSHLKISDYCILKQHLIMHFNKKLYFKSQ